MKLRLAKRTIVGERKAGLLAKRLIQEAMFFSVTPLPDDAWEFEFKVDAEPAFYGALYMVSR